MKIDKRYRILVLAFAALIIVSALYLLSSSLNSGSLAATSVERRTAFLSQARYALAATTVGTKAFFAGGVFQRCCDIGNPYSATIDIYDSATNTWETSQLSRPRAYLGATSVGDLAIFAGGAGWGIAGSVGGQPIVPGIVATDDVDIYNTETGQWSTSHLPTKRDRVVAASVGAKALFADGGSEVAATRVDIYDTATDTWSTAPLSQPRRGLAVASACGKVFFGGGLQIGVPGHQRSAVVDIYDEATNSWSTATLSQARNGLTATSTSDKVFFAGGAFSSSVTDWASAVVDIYDCGTEAWSTASLWQARASLASTSLEDIAFFAGGRFSSYRPVYSYAVDIYYGGTQTWGAASLSRRRANLAATTVGDEVIFAGGWAYPSWWAPAEDYSNRVDIFTIANQPPTANAGPDLTGNEGQSLTFDGSGSSDPDGQADIASYAWNFGDGGAGSGKTADHTYVDEGTYTAILTVTDTAGETSTDTAVVTVQNVPATIDAISAPLEPQLVDVDEVNASANFNDPGILDTHTAEWDWGDGTTTQGTVTEQNGLGLVTGSHVYSSAGTYTITLTVTDNDGGQSQKTFQPLIVQTPAEATEDLTEVVETYDLPQGITSNLEAKLDAAITVLNDANENNDAAAVKSLQAFIKTVESQRGKKITDEQADELISAAQRIIESLAD